MMSFWWQRATTQSQVEWIRGALPIIISWALWKTRCSARMDGSSFKIEDTIQTVKFLLKDASCNLKKFQHIRRNDSLVMESLNIPIVPIHKKKVAFIKWVLPERGKVKLNIDGGSCNNPGEAGGGVIRDSNGKSTTGFAHFYGIASNTVVEC